MTYKEFIDNILETRGRVLDTSEKERHHILPKCLGGSNDEENLIDLKLEEHFIAHKLLAEENPDDKRLKWAFTRMSNIRRVEGNTLIQTPEQFREARLAVKNNCIKTNYGSQLKEETKRKISIANTGKKRTPEVVEANRISSLEYYKTHESPRKGKKHSEEARRKMSLAHQGRDYSYMKNPSEESKRKRVEAFKKTYWAKPEEVRKEQTRKSVENREPVRYWEGKTILQEMRDKISATLKEKHLAPPHSIKVYCLETDTVYRSMTEAEAMTGVDRHIIKRYMQGLRKDNKYHFTAV